MIPWTTLLRHAPTILAAADSLLARSRARGAEQVQSLDERFDRLEQTDRETAQVLHGMAQQINALTAAQAAGARRLKLATMAAAVAIVVAALALALALLV